MIDAGAQELTVVLCMVDTWEQAARVFVRNDVADVCQACGCHLSGLAPCALE